MNEDVSSINKKLKEALSQLEIRNKELEKTNSELTSRNKELQARERTLEKSCQQITLENERFAMALENSKVFIAFQDKDLRYTWYYNTTEKFRDVDIIGNTDEVILKNTAGNLSDVKREVLATGEPRNFKIHLADNLWDVTIKPVFRQDTITGIHTISIDITDIHHTALELQARKSLVNTIVEEMDEAIMVVNKDYQVIDLNQKQQQVFLKYFNVVFKEGDYLPDLLNAFPTEKAKFIELLNKALEGEKFSVDKFQSKMAECSINERAFFSMQLIPMKNEEGDVISVALITKDITDLVKSEEQIHHVIRHSANLVEDDFFNDLTDQMAQLYRAKHVYFGILSDDGKKIKTHSYRINGKLVENFEYDLEDTPCSQVLNNQELEKISAIQQKFPNDPKLKKWKAKSFIGLPISSPTTGKLMGIFSMVDIHEMPQIPNSEYLLNVISLRAGAELEAKKNLTKLKARDKQLVNITQNLPQVIYEYITTDKIKDDQFTYISRAASEIFEMPEDDLYEDPQRAWKSIYDEDFQSFVIKMDACASNMQTFRWTGRILGTNTYRIRWVNITARPEKMPNGNIKWHGVISDVSQIKQIEQELQHAKQKAEELAKAKEEFLATMSHEIRTPLNGIVGITDLMISEAPPEQMEYLNLLKFSAENLMTLINNILDFSKLNAGKLELAESNIHLKILLKNLQHTHAYRARENGSDIIFDIDENIPDIIMGDDMVLLQVLNNLIGNAVKFTKNGKVKLLLNLINVDAEYLSIRFTIQDTGIGISEKDLDRIFEKFEQVGAKEEHAGGTGLGLAISKKLLEIMNSDLKVESTLGEGTTFWFELRMKKAFFDKKGDPYSDTLQIPHLSQKVNLLLVEDVEENKDMLLRYFAKIDKIEADAASNGKEALEMILNKDYDIILMDLRMPVMDGREAAARIRKWDSEKFRQLPIIALTADTFYLNEEKDFTDVITKPFSPRELRKKILTYASDKIDIEEKN